MQLRERYLKLATIATEEFSDILRRKPLILRDRIRLFFIDESFMDIRYPINHDYSFHWQMKGELYRINTAPDHPEIETFPRHIHARTEENTIPDTITSLNNTPEKNLRQVLKWVREKLKAKHPKEK
jgi:hypothetical protein